MTGDDEVVEQVAESFDLGRPLGALTPVTYTCFQTWRLDTDRGAFFVKQLWPGDDPPWWPERAAGMEFERLVLDAGLPIPRPVEPRQSWFGYASRIERHGVFRAYEWADARLPVESDDLAGWLAETLARLHGLRAPELGVGTGRDWLGVHPRQAWEGWLAAGAQRQAPWVPVVRERLDEILALSERLTRAWAAAGDLVISHGDFEPRNVLVTANGPMLTDWESVAYESATLEAARAAVAFGYADPAWTRRILDAYRAGGGELTDLGDDLFLRKASLTLCHIAELIKSALGDRPASGWMDSDGLDRQVVDKAEQLPRIVADLTRLARDLR